MKNASEKKVNLWLLKKTMELSLEFSDIPSVNNKSK